LLVLVHAVTVVAQASELALMTHECMHGLAMVLHADAAAACPVWSGKGRKVDELLFLAGFLL
jgi:hypothetical protein